ncbi:MAG: hypothetical protein H0V19_09020 [Euzebyales bacterium]|nr:hypothetical protein [Euzebyales bacterium]
MSARVNLLPPELAERQRERRMVLLVALALLAYLLLLAVFYVSKSGAVELARADRDEAQAELARL